jgi:hypothetical protein
MSCAVFLRTRTKHEIHKVIWNFPVPVIMLVRELQTEETYLIFFLTRLIIIIIIIIIIILLSLL